MGHVFPRNCHADLPTVARGEGIYLYDKAGKKYLDGSGGAAVSCLGHSDAHVIDAIKTQLDSVAFAHTGFLTSEPAERLADRLVAAAPGDLDRVYFVSGGSEAVETALKLARQYYLEIGQPERRHIIARKQSYHGNSLGALAAGGNQWRREPYAPLLIDVTHVDACYAYRGQGEGETEEAYVTRLIDQIEHEVQRLGPETVMAFVAEPVVGATLGAVASVGDYFKRLRALCDRHGILLILDEVMCGMGRTGTLFACEQDGIAPDISTIAKGLGAGYQPIGATLCTRQIYDAIAEGSGAFQHGHTYIGHPTATAAANAVLDRLINDDLVGRVSDLGSKLNSALSDRFGQHPHVGDIRGRGLFMGLELVQERETKAPFDPSHKLHAKIKSAAFEAGLICYPMGGTIDGRRGDHVLIAPPFILRDDQIGALVEALGSAIDHATSAIQS